jgi:transcription initiation factor TFIIE subunit beta
MASFNSFNSEFSAATTRNTQQKRPTAAVPTPVPRSSTPSTQPTDLKRKRQDLPQNAAYSQPADTGSGREVMTQVVYAIDYLKSKDRPISFTDIWNYLSIPANQQQHRQVLRRALMEHPKVDYDPKGLDGQHPSFRFRPVHNVRSADDLKAYLQRQHTAQGISVKELKEGWPDAIPEIVRQKKDNIPKMVWPNDPSLDQRIDQDFKDYWLKTTLPANPGDLRIELEKAGITPTSQVKEVIKVSGGKDKKKRTSRKAGRSTNTHMVGILKDYNATKK